MTKFHVEMDIETEEEIEAEVVQNDIRDYVSGEFDGLDFDSLPQYGITVEHIVVTES